MAAPNNGSGIVLNQVVSANTVTPPSDERQMMMASFQVKNVTGLDTYTVDVQVTNAAAQRDNSYGLSAMNPTSTNLFLPVPIRDDSFASLDWVTLNTATITATIASYMYVVAYVPHRAARVRLTPSNGTGTVIVYAHGQGWGS